jgi:hypothetical protein
MVAFPCLAECPLLDAMRCWAVLRSDATRLAAKYWDALRRRKTAG